MLTVPCDSNVDMEDIVLPHTASFCRSRWLVELRVTDDESDTLLVAESGVSPSVRMGGLRTRCIVPAVAPVERSDRSDCSEPIDDCSERVGSGPDPREPWEDPLCPLAAPLLNLEGSLDCSLRTFIR